MKKTLHAVAVLAALLVTANVRADESAAGRPATWIPLDRLKAAAHEAGLKAIFDVWSTYVTSTTHERYPDFYARTWDVLNGLTSPLPRPAKNETQKRTAPDPQRLAALEQTLAMTRAGREALDVVKRYGVRIEFIEGSSAGYFNHGTNLIALGANRPANDLVGTLLHEINHALTKNTGRAADPKKLTREAYVREKLADEARSDGLAAVGAREFARINRRAAKTGVRVDLGPRPTTKLYLDAYKQVIFAGRAARQGKAPLKIAVAK